MPPTVWTIGHSTRSIDEFTAILRARDIELLADIRRFPGSRRLPQFSSEALAAALTDVGIEYHWLPQLGGRRRADPGSGNAAWRHAAFRGYADHLQSEEFAGGLFELLVLAQGLRTTIMCSEVLWWRCHRRLVADVLVSLGARVVHVRDLRAAEEHRLAPPAALEGGALVYR